VIIIIGCCIGLHKTQIIDVHEHIESPERAEVLLSADRGQDVTRTVLLPSPVETLTLNGNKSFTGYRENTDELFKIKEKYPSQFEILCTVSPLEPDALQYIKDCIGRGAVGIKLYNGHSYYHDIFGIPLDSPRMDPIYAYAEKNRLPILYHVNITKYGDELERVLQSHPDLVINVPHYMVSSIGLDKVKALLDKYPNLYTDISFGSPEYMAAGFRRISNNTTKYEEFMNGYSDRILFGTDMVLTSAPEKDLDFMENTIDCYRDLLEKKSFLCDLVSDYYAKLMNDTEIRYNQCKPKEGSYCENLKEKLNAIKKRHTEVLTLNGLDLSPSVLKKIYRENPRRFLNTNS
jgi:predicted TIM-barrel fold metal-dependent hydrolase